ncbi:sulfurtransferase TusA family protein [Halopseudomonas pelagia]|uniref:sulfurtransferase TusA family protein n=1 Tax=Halopseudomonas pelagia TaxID=553151 RepID=UPI0003A31874|nr:sulfurtransferase TusA family protein [Halopseudomonas pelagia]|tara:strand:- start:986 stop:1246 length:261 start_codon:yes stop_codon:yes gene_type:complete
MTVDSIGLKIAQDVSRTLDARGLSCPLPLLKTKLELNTMVVNDILHVVATDAGSQRDMQRFAELSGNELIASETLDSEFHYWLRKR